LETEVAKHLSYDYGDRAWTVCTFAQPTGDTWPLHGRRLSPQYPYIEAEIHYAVRHEYAQTAVDVIARRTRLSFLNAQAALNALPRVVEIMGEELKWSLSRKRQELECATTFLASMGLAPGANVPEIEPHGFLEKVESAFWWGLSGGGIIGHGKGPSVLYSRAQFEAGEIDVLRAAFRQKAAGVMHVDVEKGEEEGLSLTKEDVWRMLRELPGYEGAKTKDFDYVLEEAGLGRKDELDFDEFVEICGGLKEISFAPDFESRKISKLTRRRIPVEKSGGGV